MSTTTAKGLVKETTVFNLIPESSKERAVVDIVVLRKLAANLSYASFSATKERMITMLQHCHSQEEYLRILREEVNFHESIALIQETLEKEKEQSTKLSPDEIS